MPSCHGYGPKCLLLLLLECLLLACVTLGDQRVRSRSKSDQFGHSSRENEDDYSPFVYRSAKPKERKPEAEASYIACFDSWDNNSRSTNPNPFDKEYVPSSCSKRCRDAGLPLSLLKGGECMCSSIKGFKLTRIPEVACDVPCPVSQLVTNPMLEPSPHTSCGGNLAYSLYCKSVDGGESCEDLQLVRPDLEIRGVDVLFDTFMPCGLCQSPSRCIEDGISPYYDYFPKASPHSCIEFCGHDETYATSLTESILEERIRHATKYAALMWDRVLHGDRDPIPICRCMDDVTMFQPAESVDKCSTLCPGDLSARCGRKDRDLAPDITGGYYATIHCTQPDCSSPLTTPKPSTTTVPVPTFASTQSSTRITITSTTTTEIATTTTNAVETSLAEVPRTSTEAREPTTHYPATTTEDWHSDHEDGSPPNLHCVLMCEAIEYSGRHWQVCAGQVEQKKCNIANATGFAFWECSPEGYFTTDQPVYSKCRSGWLEEFLKESHKINDTSSAIDYLSLMQKYMSHKLEHSTGVNYFGHEIKVFTDTIKKVQKLANNFTRSHLKFESVVEKTVDVSHTIVTSKAPWHQLSQAERSKVSTNLLKTVEDSALQLALKVQLSQTIPSYEKILSGSSFSSQFYVISGATNKTITTNDNSLRMPNWDPGPGCTIGFDDSYIKLPHGWRSAVGTNDETAGGETDTRKIPYVSIQMDAEFSALLLPGQFKSLTQRDAKDDDGNSKVINGKLMSLTLALDDKMGSKKDEFGRVGVKFTGKGVEVAVKHDLQAWGNRAKKIRRKLHSQEAPSVALGSAQCVFWNVNDQNWSTKGCKILQKSREQTVCECDHLTSFAVLMDVHDYLGKDAGLEILTLVLCTVSFFCLVASITVFSTFHGIQSERNTIVKHLSICLLIGNTFVLLILDRHYFYLSDGFCVASGMITHYVFLSAFIWMGLEGAHLYRLVVHVFDTEDNHLNLYRALSYGVPLVLVIITVAVGYVNGDHPYGGDAFCWLQGNYVWSFLLPILLIVMENLVVLFIALKTAYRVQSKSNRKKSAMEDRIRSFRIWLRGSLSLTVLLGISWLTGFFILIPDNPGVVAGYIFTLFNASQGIFIFLFHCLFNDKVRSLTYHRYGSYLPSWISTSLYSSTSSNSASVGRRASIDMKKESSKKRESETSSVSPNFKDLINVSPNARRTTEASIDSSKLSEANRSAHWENSEDGGTLRRRESFDDPGLGYIIAFHEFYNEQISTNESQLISGIRDSHSISELSMSDRQ